MIVSLLGGLCAADHMDSGFLLPPAFHYVENVYVSYPVTWTITLTAHIVCYIIIMRKHQKTTGNAEACAA